MDNKYVFNAHIIKRLTGKTVALCDNDIEQFKETIQQKFQLGEKIKIMIIKQL